MIGVVNELKVRNEEKWDSINYQMDSVATYQTRRRQKRNWWWQRVHIELHFEQLMFVMPTKQEWAP